MSRVDLVCKNANGWRGDAALVFTHPYSALPPCLHDTPAIINLYLPPGAEKVRRTRAERWVGKRDLHELGSWGEGGRNTLFTTEDDWSVPFPPVVDLIEDPFEPGKGWMPEALPLSVLTWWLDAVGEIDGPVWDGFCGRGTIGRACQQLGLDYIGVDIDESRVKMAREYLGLNEEAA